jgi:hypothetical protein
VPNETGMWAALLRFYIPQILIALLMTVVLYFFIRAIEKNKSFKGIPFGFHFIRFWQAILPTRVFDWLFGEVFGIYHTMDEFTGRKNAKAITTKAS